MTDKQINAMLREINVRIDKLIDHGLDVYSIGGADVCEINARQILRTVTDYTGEDNDS